MTNQHTPRNAQDADVHAGTKLRMLRYERKMSQETLGFELGVTFQQVQRYERGSNRIGFSRLIAICQLFSVSTEYFAEGLLNPTSLEILPNGAINRFIQSHDGCAFAEAIQAVQSGPQRRQLLELIRAMSHTSNEEE